MGNITNDPEFVDMATGDYHLRHESPCIGTGTNMAWMVGAIDLNGENRSIKGKVNMGCYGLPRFHDMAGMDTDGDGTTDLCVYDATGIAPGSWYFMQTTDGFSTSRLGYPGCTPISGDFDGDGKTDYAVYDSEGLYGQPAGSWYFMKSTDGFSTDRFGYAGTVPVVGDFDGDGTYDYGCYDADGNFGQSPGSWYIMQSTDGFRTETFGYAGTIPPGSTVTTP